MKRISVLGATALVLGLAGGPALAQNTASSTPNAAPPTQEQREHAVQTFGLIASGLQSANVPNDVKSVLMGCVYENPIGKISETVDNALAANPGKVDRTKADQMLAVIAQICGYEPPAAGAAAPGKTPAAPGKAPAAAPSGAHKGR